jgi:hypothetical protein
MLNDESAALQSGPSRRAVVLGALAGGIGIGIGLVGGQAAVAAPASSQRVDTTSAPTPPSPIITPSYARIVGVL